MMQAVGMRGGENNATAKVAGITGLSYSLFQKRGSGKALGPGRAIRVNARATGDAKQCAPFLFSYQSDEINPIGVMLAFGDSMGFLKNSDLDIRYPFGLCYDMLIIQLNGNSRF